MKYPGRGDFFHTAHYFIYYIFSNLYIIKIMKMNIKKIIITILP
jgi:hypothetical protein